MGDIPSLVGTREAARRPAMHKHDEVKEPWIRHSPRTRTWAKRQVCLVIIMLSATLVWAWIMKLSIYTWLKAGVLRRN